MPLHKKPVRQDRSGQISKHMVYLEEKQETVLGQYGEDVGGHRKIHRIRGLMEQLTGRELENARQLVPYASYRFSTRNYSMIRTADRLTYNGVVYNVGAIRVHPDNQWAELICGTSTDGDQG